LFKVPRLYFERNSGIFRDLFTVLVSPGDKPTRGSCDENPLALKSIQKVDFQRLLRAMFPDLAFKATPMGSEEWISVLKLSTMWTFGELRQLAIKWLGRLDINPVEKVMLARNYKVERLLVRGYMELIKRKEGPSVEEAKILGYEAAIRLYEKRERHRGSDSSVSRLPQRRQEHVVNANLIADIKKTFKEELDSIKRDSRETEEASRPNNYGQPSRSAAFISDWDSDWELDYLDVPLTRKRARRGQGLSSNIG